MLYNYVKLIYIINKNQKERLKNMNNIVSVQKFKTNKITLSEVIVLLLNSKTINTRKTYEKAYNDFFKFLFNKSYIDCTWDDISKIEYTDVLKFIEILQKEYSYQTIKTKLGALQFLAKEISKIKQDIINPSYFSVKLKNREKNNTYGSLTYDECMALLEYTKCLKSNLGITAYLFFKLMIITAHRVNNLLNLRWKDIKISFENGIQVPYIEIYDKTDYFKTAISLELYYELLNNLYKGNQFDKVFKISSMTLARKLNKFCNFADIDKNERNIVLHSLKKASGDIAYNKTGGDIVSVAKHLHHTNIQTAYNHYLNKNNKLDNQISFKMLDDKDINSNLEKQIQSMDIEQLSKKLCILDYATKNNIINILKK